MTEKNMHIIKVVIIAGVVMNNHHNNKDESDDKEKPILVQSDSRLAASSNGIFVTFYTFLCLHVCYMFITSEKRISFLNLRIYDVKRSNGRRN